jgi:predicted ATPase/DNA-binding SARP family transcriptional activator
VRFGVLGPLAVWTDDGRPVVVAEVKVRALLADLLLHLGRPVSADRLIDDLWGDDLPVHPAGALQSKVSRLRQALENAEPGGGELVVFRSPGYLLQVDGDAVDERRFAALAGRAGATEHPRDRVALLADALALWRGPPLADFADAMFARAAIVRLEEQRLVALEDQAEARLALGEHSLLAGELGELVSLHPLRERLRAAQMLALYRAGRQAEAVTSYAELRGRLADDLGLDPGPALAALHQAILEQAPGLQGAPSPPTLAARPRTNIPVLLTDTVGRTAAVAEIRALLNTRRLVTLTGPGGVGKTRLALETAIQSAGAFPDGVWLVELAGSARAGAGAPADLVMAVLGIRDDSPMDPVDLLAEALRASRMLLILDNCEHLIDQAAKLTARLLRAAPELAILVTSREPLVLAGEVVWAVPPLELPDLAADPEPGALAQFSAVQLFVTRAGASAPGFRLDEGNARAVAALCRRLDGIPLALELAATRVRSLGVDELLARLDDRFRLLSTGHRDAPARQRTLWAVIDWSWELLTAPERLVLRRLAVTVDGCSLHAAEAICAEDDLDVAGLVSRLVDRSLVVAADGPDGLRYRLLESVAAYGLQRLHQAGECGQLRWRHRRYYTDLAERAVPHLRGHDQRSWLRRLDTEAANLRNALDSAVKDNNSAALRLVNALAWYWLLRGRLTEARRALDEALALGHGSAAARAIATAWRSGFTALAGERSGHPAPPPPGGIDDPGIRATLEWFHAFVASDFGDPSVAEALVGRALASFRALGDQWGIAAALSTRAKLAMIRGDPVTAQGDARQSLAMFRELGDRWGQLQAIEWLGAAEAATGHHTQAGRLHHHGLRVAEELGLWPQAADALSWLGRNALHVGDLAQAREFLERAMRLAIEQSYLPGHVFAELGLGQTARREGKLDVAEAHLRRVLQTSRRPGSEPDMAHMISWSELGFIAEQRGDPATAGAWHLESLNAAQGLGDQQAVAQALTGLAGAQALGGQHDRAAQMLGAADTAWRSAGASLPAGDSADFNRITAVTRRALGEAAFAAGFENGRRLRPEQAASLLADHGGLPDGDGGVGEAGDVYRGARGDEALALVQVAGPVHGEDADQAACRQPAGRPGRFGRVAAPQHAVRAAVVAGVLHHPAELLGPEVRHRVVGLVTAENVGRDHLGRVQGHVPVLEAQPAAEPPRLERGAVSHRVDAGPGGAQPGVHGHAVLQPHAGPVQPAGGRAYPDRGDDLVRLDHPAAGQGQPAGLHRLDRGGDPQVHPGGRVPAGGLRAQRGADRRGQRRGPGLHHRDLAAAGRRRGGQFGADPAGPHDGQPQCLPSGLAGPEQVPQRQRVVVGAQEALPPWPWQRHRQRPGGQHQVVERVAAAVRD